METKHPLMKYVLIIVFSIIFGFVIQDALRLVIFKYCQISNQSYGLAEWGDIFFLRIIASIIGTFSGAFVIGTFFEEKAKFTALVASFPTLCFWIIVLYYGFPMMLKEGTLFDGMKHLIIAPIILIVATPLVAFFSAGIGSNYTDFFDRANSILNIKWFNWLWIIPLYLSKIVAVILFTVILLWKVDFLYSNVGAYPSIINIVFNWNYYAVRVCIFITLTLLICSVNNVYFLLAEDYKTSRVKKSFMVTGHVLLFSIIHAFLFHKFM